MSTRSSKIFLSVFLSCCFFGSISLAHANSSDASRADCAKLIGNSFELALTSDPKTLYGLLDNGFPAGYENSTSISMYQEPCTLEVLTVAIVQQSGISVTDYTLKDVESLKRWVSPKGIPYYAPDPTPRSIPFVKAALTRGILKTSDLPRLKEQLTLKRASDFINYALTKLQNIATKNSVSTIVLEAPAQVKTISKNFKGFVLLSPNFPKGKLPDALSTHLVLDLRSGSPRLLTNGGGTLGNGNQDYFPLGALSTGITASLFTPKFSLDHQSQAIHGNVESESETVNAIGVWGSAKSAAAAARVWGSFFNVTNSKNQDAQLVGAEIDVTNYAKPGTAPNESKVGLQVVGLGTALNTNAIEVLASDGGLWVNGILFDKTSVAPSGAIIGSGITGTVSRGLDFSSTKFSDAAIKLSPGSQVIWSKPDQTSAGIYLGDGKYGDKDIFTFRSGSEGFRITDVTGQKTFLYIDRDGKLITPALLGASLAENKNYLIPAILAGAGTSVIILFVCMLLFFRKVRGIIKSIQS
jgi:hypothetical protein